MKFVIAGIDGSETSREAFHEATREAVWRIAEVLAVHVVSFPLMSGWEYTPLDMNDFQVAGKRLLADELGKLEATYESGFPVSVRSKVVLGHTAVELMNAAKNDEVHPDGAELLVVDSRGMGGFRGLLLGSVTTYLSHHLPCRLLVVPASEQAA